MSGKETLYTDVICRELPLIVHIILLCNVSVKVSYMSDLRNSITKRGGLFLAYLCCNHAKNEVPFPSEK